MDQFWRLCVVGWPKGMTEVVHHMEREQTERQHGLDRVEVQRRQVVHPQAGVLGEKVLDPPPCGVGRHGGVRGHVRRGRAQREVRAIALSLEQHPQRAVEVRHGRVDGRHVAPDGLVILLQGDGVKLHQAFGRRLDGRQAGDPILDMECLEQLPAVPFFVCDQEEVPPEDVPRQAGQSAGDLGDSSAGVGRQGNEGFLGRLVLGIEGTDRLAVAVLLGDKGMLHRLARVGLNVVAIDVDRGTWGDLGERDEAVAQRGLEV